MTDPNSLTSDEYLQGMDHWGFVAIERLPGGHCSHVWADDSRVLKIPFQGEELTSGLVAAIRMAGHGAPRVFESDTATGRVLMERLRPGTPMKLPDTEALPIFAALIEQHAGLPTDGLLSVENYTSASLPTTQRVFLHGDLHHENVLRHGHRWLAIDPKGLEGDPCFAASAILRNPSPGCANVASECRRRLEWFHRRFGWEPRQMLDWAVADLGEGGEQTWRPIYGALVEVRGSL